jgi:hypothetical protein
LEFIVARDQPMVRITWREPVILILYIIYQCSAANIPATEKGYCSYCAKSEKAGTDYCAIGKAVNDRAGNFINWKYQ